MPKVRSAKAHSKVLEAALQLFSERGIEATSMDSISVASGVSKATIYKHWPDKDALALESLAFLFGLYDEPPSFDSGDVQADIVASLTYDPSGPREELRERIMPHVFAYAIRHNDFGAQWRARIMEMPQARLRQILERGIAN